MSFEVGHKVICTIAVKDVVKIKGAHYPVKDATYTVREVRKGERHDGVDTVLFDELDNSHFVGVKVPGKGVGYREPGFPANGFRRASVQSSEEQAA